MTTQPGDISVTLPVGQALSHVKTVLFKPFDLGKWFVIGFCAWLAYLGQEGSGGSFNTGSWHNHRGAELRAGLERAWDYVMHNLAWIAPLAFATVMTIVAIGLLLMWISSRGKFMFLHCVALNRAEVRLPWQTFAGEANSLFLFRLVISLLGMVVALPAIVGLVWVVLRMILTESVSAGGIIGAAVLVLALMGLGLVFWVIKRLLEDFVVPIQFLRRGKCLTAWSELRQLLAGNLSHFILYLLFRIVLSLGIAMLVIGIVLVTCCIAGCLFAIPYLGTVLLLPILVFERSYSIYYLAQHGPEYDVLAPPADAAAGQTTV
jgi:hypothetical protein